jgi:hypothetical protein
MRAQLLLLLSLTAADDRKTVKVVCPVDGTEFSAIEILTRNEWGGVDADFCPHAFKNTPLEYFVWVCPACRYAGRKRDFALTLTGEERTKIAMGVKPMAEIRRDAKQAEIPGHVKYDLLAQVAKLRDAKPDETARAYLHASWSARQQGAVALEGFDEWETLRDSYALNRTPMQLGTDKNKRPRNRTEVELDIVRKIEKDIEARKYEKGSHRILARYLAAYLHRKHGENAEALKWLDVLDGLKGENSVADAACVRMRASILLERDFQKKALEGYAAAVDGGGLGKQARWETLYLVGELHRRLSDAKAAADGFRKVLDGDGPESLKQLATAQLAKLPR